MKIVILCHELARGQDTSVYTIHYLAEWWRKAGIEVEFIYGTATFVPADIVIVHVDFTVVPKKYLDFAGQYPVAINKSLVDVSKSFISKGSLGRASAWQGQVIVKSNLNYAGLQERYLGTSWLEQKSYRYNQFKERLKHWLYSTPRFEGAYDYKIFDSRQQVPTRWFSSRDVIIEKFVPEIENGLYHVRIFQVLGDNWTCQRLASTQPIVKGGNCVKAEYVEPEKEVFQWCSQFNVEYGKLDYVVHQGQPVLLDVNKTVGATGLVDSEDNSRKRKYLAEGIFHFVRKADEHFPIPVQS